ncbi:MAG TPA: hypothetical protein VFU54_01945 [Actinomycetota bacterium]|nr:hypothetical protein [Actinomycetota bacterium]
MSDSPAPPAVAPAHCVFCSRPVVPAERCPLLPSSHWACCGCETPAAGQERAFPETGDAA